MILNMTGPPFQFEKIFFYNNNMEKSKKSSVGTIKFFNKKNK